MFFFIIASLYCGGYFSFLFKVMSLSISILTPLQLTLAIYQWQQHRKQLKNKQTGNYSPVAETFKRSTSWDVISFSSSHWVMSLHTCPLSSLSQRPSEPHCRRTTPWDTEGRKRQPFSHPHLLTVGFVESGKSQEHVHVWIAFRRSLF